MFRSIKINTAVVICAAFVFRLLFVNLGLITPFSSSQTKSNIQRHFSTVIKKRRKQIDPVADCKKSEISSPEIFEEVVDKEEAFKASSLPILFLFPFLIEQTIAVALKKFGIFTRYFLSDSSRRYIDYQVFRI